MRQFATSFLAAAVLVGCGDDATSERQAGAERRAPSPASPGPSADDRRALTEAQELIASCRSSSSDVAGQLPGAVAIIESLAQFYPGDETVRGAAREAQENLRSCGEGRLARRAAAAASS